MSVALIEPSSLEAEEYILGAMMLSPVACDSVLEVLEQEGERKFYSEKHGLIYRAIRGLRTVKRPTDPISVIGLLEQKSALENAGGKERIREIATLVPASSNAAHHASIVLSLWKRRQVIDALTHALTAAKEEPDPELALGIAERATLDLRGMMERGVEEVSWTGYQAAEFLDDMIHHPPNKDDSIPGPWGFVQRMERGDLYILGGYSADGKTAVSGQFAYAASQHGKKVGYATMEMSRGQIAIRFASMLGAPAAPFRTGNFHDGVKAEVAAAIAKLAVWDVDIYDDAAVDVPGLSRYINRAKLDFLIVDHLHQFRIHNPQYERAELEQIITDLKQLARRVDIPILLLAQLKRVDGGRNPFPRPTMASLKGTSKIEQLASVVWFVWRKRDDKMIATEESEFITAKNRHGDTGVRPLYFDKTRVRFTEAARTPFGGQS